LSTYKTVLPS